MSQVLDMGNNSFCALPSLDHLDGGVCLLRTSDVGIWYAVDGCFYAVLYDYADIADDDGNIIGEEEVYDVRTWTRTEVVELLTENYGEAKTEAVLSEVLAAERGEPKTGYESIAYLSAELEEVRESIDLRRADEDAREVYAVSVEKISRLLARVVRDMEAEPTRGVLRYDVAALMSGVLKDVKINTSILT